MEMRTRGRPKKDESRDQTYSLRLNEEDSTYLEYLHEITGKSRSDILRKALKMYFEIEIRKGY